MREYSSVIVFVVFLFFLSSSYRQKNNQRPDVEGTGKWTGTLTLEEKYTGITGLSERHVHVSFTDALPTLYRTDTTTNLDFADDKGTGTVTYHSEAIIGGKKIGTTDCEGSGKSELHEVVVDEADNTYRIHAIGPHCNGTTVSLLDGKTDPYGPEFTDIIVSDQRLANKNALAGTKTTVNDIGGSTITTTISWNLVRSPSNVELIVTPHDYDDWLPKPGRDEFNKGSVINISLKLLGRNGQPPTLKAKAFELRLSNTSSEPGITLNAPLIPQLPLPDLRFLVQPNAQIAEEFQFIRINCNNCLTGDVYIGAFDGGGWTTLTAVAILEDGNRIQGHLLVSGGIQEIPIPKRAAGSKIATAWLVPNGDPPEMDDTETSGGNTNDGDGLTAYEEYRGVISEGHFRRLDPVEKELGVRVKRAELPLFSDGLSWFENASGIKIIRFFENEIGQDRRLNKNASSTHIYDQCALNLEKKHIRIHVLGRVEPGPGIPKTITRVMIDYDQIVQQQQETERDARLQNIQLPFTLKERVAQTVAHELAHGVNVSHHGNDELLVANKRINPNDPVRIFTPYGRNEITKPYSIVGVFGKSHNQASGDIFCIMNYNSQFSWAARETPDSLFFYMVPLLPVGNLMCNSKDGTDINATPNYFGDATVGKCLSQTKLKN